jgi:hypothetical protein
VNEDGPEFLRYSWPADASLNVLAAFGLHHLFVAERSIFGGLHPIPLVPFRKMSASLVVDLIWHVIVANLGHRFRPKRVRRALARCKLAPHAKRSVDASTR